MNDAVPSKSLSQGLYRRAERFLFAQVPERPRAFSGLAGPFLVVLSVICAIATYASLTRTGDFSNNSRTVIWLLNIDLIVLLMLAGLIARRIAGLFSGRRRGVAASKLHVRLVFSFCLMAAVPAILMTVFSALFLHVGVESWFSQRIRTAVMDSQAVAEAYLEEHKQVIRADTLAMANDLDRDAPILTGDTQALGNLINTQSLLRNLSEAEVIDGGGRVVARSNMTLTLAFDAPPVSAMRLAQDGDVAVMAGSGDRVRALVRLGNYPDLYLYVGRMADPTVLSHVADTHKASEAYHVLESQRSRLQVKITLIYIAMALLLMLVAMWFGLQFARQLVRPIEALIAAADQIRAGDMTARVPEVSRGDEFDNLGRAFNRMTLQIQQQRDELMNANRQIDQRRHFTETVLAGVSAGIIGIDDGGRIMLANSSASDLLGSDIQGLTGHNVSEILPDIDPLLAQARQKPSRIAQAEVPWISGKDVRRTFLFRVAIEATGGAVLTFDDITELQSAQRQAAWADVARRIAHEIKNPLTPIQLSAERLKRRYLKQITEDREIFSKCTDTIIHHVGDIGRMVNEFSAFARMPEPVMRQEDIARILSDLLFLQRQAHPAIKFVIQGEKIPMPALADAQQVRQAFTNILQNAIDSIEARVLQDPSKDGRLTIVFHPMPDSGDLAVAVSDNGLGLPKGEDVNRLTEPYVTHREKGTGLGLAIVKKIMEDHKGRIVIGTPDWLRSMPDWQDLAGESGGGATVCLVFPADNSASRLEPGGAVA